MKFITVLFILLSFGACTNHNEVKADFELKNMTNHIIDSVKVKTFDNPSKINYVSLMPGETKIMTVDMNDILKIDGHYELSVKRNNSNLEKMEFGYYTNGYPSEELTKIEILEDTIIMNYIIERY